MSYKFTKYIVSYVAGEDQEGIPIMHTESVLTESKAKLLCDMFKHLNYVPECHKITTIYHSSGRYCAFYRGYAIAGSDKTKCVLISKARYKYGTGQIMSDFDYAIDYINRLCMHHTASSCYEQITNHY